MTRGTIRSRVEYYLDRADLRALIYGWIEDARLDVALKGNFHYLYTEACANTVASSATYSLPSDFLGHEMVWCNNKKLARMTAREFDELTETDSKSTALPRNLVIEDGSTVSQTVNAGPPDYYVDRGMNIELYPTPDAAYVMRIKYYAQPTAWTTTDTSQDANYDYITTFHPEVIIWGASLRGAIYLDDDTKVQKFEGAYGNAIQEMLRKEKDFALEDQHPRMKSWRDYDLTTFKRLTRVNT